MPETRASGMQKLRPGTARLITPKTLDDLEDKYATSVEVIERELHDQVQFIPFVRSQFVGFHEGAYLQLSVIVNAQSSADESRYKIAALTFDEHIVHLLRLVIAHFQKAEDFDGIVFSVIVKAVDRNQSIGIEYYLPLKSLHSYAHYDYTGQDLLDSGFVLINGESAKIDLQTAERTR